jgi:hypothetical protein
MDGDDIYNIEALQVIWNVLSDSNIYRIGLESVCEISPKENDPHLPRDIILSLENKISEQKNLSDGELDGFRYYKRANDFLSSIQEKILRSSDSIWFYGVNFYISAAEHRDLILGKLAQGVKIRYLIYNYESEEFENIAKNFDQSTDSLKLECEKGLQGLLDLMRGADREAVAPLQRYNLEIRVTDEPPTFRLYAFDPIHSSGEIYFIPYILGVSSPNTPGYLIRTAKDGPADVYIEKVKELWESARLLSDSGLRLRQSAKV